jgi:NAD(P)-dependent dehydrogenase (short-subunit alcohol dehydrogenase family)
MSAGTAAKAGRLDGRKVLITGAASGIGRATALLFAEEGAKLALLDVNAAGLKDTADKTGAVSVVCDLLDTAKVPGAVKQVAEALGGLDGVVNSAGVAAGNPIEELDIDTWSRVIGVNLTGTYLVCRAAAPYLRKSKGGAVVNIASGQALLPVNAPGACAYTASKGGVLSFSQALAADLAPTVRVNVICPGVTNTPIIAPIIAGYANPNDSPFVQAYALKRMAEPIEQARAILFLISGESSYVTGAAIAIDGGRSYH